MPFLRPEAVTSLRRWREPAVIAVAMAFAIWLLWKAYIQSSVISGLIGLAVAALVGSLLYVSYLRARLRRDVSGPGVVEINERSITYFSPVQGGEVEVDNISRIQISTLPSASGDRNWILWHGAGSLVIPAAAEGADRLIETFASLNGFKYETILKAMETETQEIFTIWSA